MADRNRELVPYNWSLVRERVLTTGLCSEGWYSEHTRVSVEEGLDKAKFYELFISMGVKGPKMY